MRVSAAVLGALLTALCAVLAPSRACADARSDLAAIERGELPQSAVFLGFGPDGSGYLRTLSCTSSGTNRCVAAVVQVPPTGPNVVTTLLEVAELYCGSGDEARCAAVLTAAVQRDFIAAEAAALAALPTLVPRRAVAHPAGLCGLRSGAPTQLRVRGGERDADEGPIELVLASAHGRSIPLLTLTRADAGNGRVQRAWLTPGGASAVLVVTVTNIDGEWTTAVPRIVRLALPCRRGSTE